MKQRAASGMAWAALQKYSAMGIQFISGIILARLLTPYDYGCIGMLTIFMVLAEAFIDGGFGSALIQKKRPTQEDYSTIFYWNLGVALLMYAVLYFCAPAIARFYDIPLLCDVLRVQGLVLFIYAFNIVQRNQLKKQLNFKVLSIVTITTSIIALSVTIVLAYKGFGVWALVVQHLITAAIPAVVFWFFIKWRPKLVFSWKSFKELFSFGFYMFLTNLLNQLGNQIQGLLIGRVYDSSTMGYYSKAKSTEELASTSISGVMGQVTYPLYAECQHDLPVLINVIKRITISIAYLTFPIMALLFLLAKPIFVLLYSERWLESVPYFQILCIAGIAISLQGVNYLAVAAVGKSKQMFTWTVVKRVVGLLFVVSGLILGGIWGLLVGMVLQSWLIYFINSFQVHKYIGYKITRQMQDLLPIVVLSLIAFIAAFLAGDYFSVLNMYPLAIIQLFVFVIIYLGGSMLMKMESFKYVRETIPLVFGKFKRN